MVEKQCNFSLIKQSPQSVRGILATAPWKMGSAHLITPFDDNSLSERHLVERLLLFLPHDLSENVT